MVQWKDTMDIYEKTNEVNITTPTLAQQQMMNPYAFINMYRNGYSLSMKTQGKNYIVHMKASNKSIQEIYVTINKSTHIPSAVKFRQGSVWTSITISKISMKINQIIYLHSTLKIFLALKSWI